MLNVSKSQFYFIIKILVKIIMYYGLTYIEVKWKWHKGQDGINERKEGGRERGRK